ncbi:hypothetical protein E3N88_27106 [Mikania micrantha]|uniref:Uncharacterized protein n=1 Tax=Mikania micrantha TaxID=192012 RepID=A0A5N6MYK7_9ASTR|nr:hypothetical protein E3N88_27106 [Mikania micrantha]
MAAAASSLFMATTLSPLTTPSSSQFLNRNVKFSIKCMSQPQAPLDEEANPTEASNSPPKPTNLPPLSTPSPSPKVSTKFSDVLAFSGPAPERINGRLAMIGFVSAMAVELSSGQDVLTQISNGGVAVFLGTSVVLSLASLVPLFKGTGENAIYKYDGDESNGHEVIQDQEYG